jgi:uncharacterized phage protein (TIGR01671 family)
MSSREIKFRVWNKKFNGWDTIESFDSNINNLFKIDNFTFQQYTGLKDKNGKEIYEGDILKETHYEYTGRLTDLVRDPEKMESYPYRGVVYWTEGCPCNTKDSTNAYALLGFRTFPLDTTVGQTIGNSITRDCEVVGNMYENPEMMKHGPYGPKFTE